MSDTSASPVLVDKNLIYGMPQGYRPLELDLYRPDGPGPHPLVVQVHGGAWRVSTRHTGPRETRGWARDIFHRLVDAGFAVAAVEYRYSSEAKHPTQVDDVAAAVGWLRAHADEYGLDIDRFVLWGQSAGGHLAAMVGLDPACGPFRAVCCWYMVADLRLTDHTAPDSAEAELLGHPVGDDLEAAFRASPVSRVHPDAPPFLLIHGTADTWAIYQHSLAMRGALEAAGVPVELVTVEGAEHFFMGADDRVESLFGHTVQFLRSAR